MSSIQYPFSRRNPTVKLLLGVQTSFSVTISPSITVQYTQMHGNAHRCTEILFPTDR